MLHHVLKLYLVLGAREGENKKVNLSQSLKASPRSQDTLHQATTVTASQDTPGRWTEEAASTSAGEGDTQDPR